MHSDHAGESARYWPALDGLRGLAVAAVLLFHGGFAWAEGGYLGVSTFFTLSGFLITTLLLRESGRGRIDLLAFWGRRIRRLMPAALLGVLVAVAYAAFAAPPSVLAELRGDVVAALAYVANWRFALTQASYADLFGAPSPLLHFWSLAIEEQFYLFYPLVLGGAVIIGRRRPWAVPATVLGLLGASLLAMLILVARGASDDRIYFGTDVRIAEVLVGAVLALLVGRLPSLADRRWVPAVGVGGLVAVVVAWTTVGLERAVLYHGGLLVYAVASAAVVLAAIGSGGPVVRVLSAPPLQQLGRISYGVYVYHWPVFLWLDGSRTGWDDGPLFVLRSVVTLVIAVASYVLVEQPIRRGGALRGAVPWAVAPAVAMAAIVWAAAVTQSVPRNDIDFEGTRAALEQLGDAAPIDPDDIACPDGTAVPTASRAEPRFVVVGDSTALNIAYGVGSWARCTGAAEGLAPISELGCGVVVDGDRRFLDGERPIPDGCRRWFESWLEQLDVLEEQIIVVGFGPWDVLDHRLEPGGPWLAPGDPTYDRHLSERVGLAMDRLVSTGAPVAWMTTPNLEIGQQNGVAPEEPFPASAPQRVERVNEIFRAAAATRPEVTVFEYGARVNALPNGGLDADTRPDGVHLGLQASQDLAYAWLGPKMLDLWLDTGAG